MKLFTQLQYKKLLKNGLPENTDKNVFPVVKLFTPYGAATWLLTHLDPEDPDLAFGLCDLGCGFPELGYVSLTDLKSVRDRIGRPIERDLHFKPLAPISIYAEVASKYNRILEDSSYYMDYMKK